VFFDEPEPHGFWIAKNTGAFFYGGPLLFENAVLTPKPIVL